MTREDKELLLKDLCARLPYGVKVRCDFGLDGEITEISRTKNNLYYCKYLDCKEGYCYIESLKPYLFPLSSMTEEQKDDMIKSSCGIGSDKNVFDWWNKNHFDYRGLIPM